MSARASVYRFYDASGSLLYVGMTEGFEARLSVHKSASPWWPRVTHTTLERFETRHDAAHSERRAILLEKPEFNVRGQARTAGHPFRMLRQEQGVSREELAENASCSESMIRHYEAGRKKPRIDTACRLADALGVGFMDVARCFVPVESVST